MHSYRCDDSNAAVEWMCSPFECTAAESASGMPAIQQHSQRMTTAAERNAESSSEESGLVHEGLGVRLHATSAHPGYNAQQHEGSSASRQEATNSRWQNAQTKNDCKEALWVSDDHVARPPTLSGTCCTSYQCEGIHILDCGIQDIKSTVDFTPHKAKVHMKCSRISC
jgi:hypothetical protein